MQNRIRDLFGPRSFLALDPGWKNSNPGSGMNILDPQHCQRVPYILVKNIRNRPKNLTR
jgi:hypothetical protein